MNQSQAANGWGRLRRGIIYSLKKRGVWVESGESFRDGKWKMNEGQKGWGEGQVKGYPSPFDADEQGIVKGEGHF